MSILTLSPSPHIAVVDDDEAVRVMFRAWLHTEGCTCELFVNGAQAEAGLAAREFDLLICDVHLPDTTGPELVGRISGLNARLPVIFLTGEPTVATAMSSVRLRAAAYLEKPPELEELRRLVFQEVSAHRYRRAVSASRKHLAEWDVQLAQLEQLAAGPEGRPAIGYLQVTVHHLSVVLGELDRSVSLVGAEPANRERFEQLDLVNSLRRTVGVLERTREHFKSKDLGELRRDLVALLHRIDGA
jgi:FixJ family two-component response regulator